MYSSDQEVSKEAVVVEQGEHNHAKADAAEVVEVTEAVAEEHEGVVAEEDGSFLCSRQHQDGRHQAVLLGHPARHPAQAAHLLYQCLQLPDPSAHFGLTVEFELTVHSSVTGGCLEKGVVRYQ